MRFGCLLVSASTVMLAAAAPSQKEKRAGVFKWFGVNQSGAEFGSTAIPGVLGTDYTWPVTSTIDTLVATGMNIFRIPILMERIIPTSMTGKIDADYAAGLSSIVDYITTTKGAYAIIDAQNFGRYYGDIITDDVSFQAFWKTLAATYASNSKVIFDCNNEFHDMGSDTLVADLDQACINGIRAAGATTQYIFVEGTSYTGAWTWVSAGNSVALAKLTDPSDLIVYEMHQYLDSDGSGTSDQCVSATIGSERLAAATAWLKSSGKLAILGEFAGGSNTVCISAVKDLITYMGDNSDVWLGGLWWGGGPWWGNYIFSMEPPSGLAYVNILPSILALI